MSENPLVKRDGAVLASSLVKMPAALLFDEQRADGERLFNFDPATQEGAELLFLSEEEGTREPLQHTETPFEMKWWACKSITLPSKSDGAPIRCVRVVLISADRETLPFTSQGVVSSLDLIRALKGDGPYDPAIRVTVRPQRTSGGFTLYRLRVHSALAEPAA